MSAAPPATPATPATQQLAQFVAGTAYGDLPASLVAECKIATLDVLAAAFVGSSMPWARRVEIGRAHV